MDEGHYRDIYHQVNEQRCVFEKSILTRQTMCEHAHRFCLADREGVSCHNIASHEQCRHLLEQQRCKAIFALKLTRIDGPLPHAKEVKVQTGGLLGLAAILDNTGDDVNIKNITDLIRRGIEKYGSIEQFPFDEITRRIVQFEGRQRRRGRRG